MLDRAFDPTAAYSRADIALAEEVAAIVPVTQPASERFIRQSIGTLSAAMPAQQSGVDAGALKLNAYQMMLEGCDERALAYACRRCIAELDWMPTVHQLLERMAEWISPERSAIARAKTIIRSGRRMAEDGDARPVTAEEMRLVRERSEAATRAVGRPRVQPVPFDSPTLEPHQLRIPNKDDYERLFGIDPETQRRKADAMEAAEQEYDADLLAEAHALHLKLHAA